MMKKKPVLRIRDVYPGYRIRIFPILDPGSATKISSILTQKIVFKLSDISSRIRILIFFPIPDPGVKKAPDPGYGSATLKKHCSQMDPAVPAGGL
jgi:hypothetical protein